MKSSDSLEASSENHMVKSDLASRISFACSATSLVAIISAATRSVSPAYAGLTLSSFAISFLLSASVATLIMQEKDLGHHLLPLKAKVFITVLGILSAGFGFLFLIAPISIVAASILSCGSVLAAVIIIGINVRDHLSVKKENKRVRLIHNSGHVEERGPDFPVPGTTGLVHVDSLYGRSAQKAIAEDEYLRVIFDGEDKYRKLPTSILEGAP